MSVAHTLRGYHSHVRSSWIRTQQNVFIIRILGLDIQGSLRFDPVFFSTTGLRVPHVPSVVSDCVILQSLPASSVHGILQARILERVAIPFYRGSSWPKDWTHVSCICCYIYFKTREQRGFILHYLLWSFGSGCLKHCWEAFLGPTLTKQDEALRLTGEVCYRWRWGISRDNCAGPGTSTSAFPSLCPVGASQLAQW